MNLVELAHTGADCHHSPNERRNEVMNFVKSGLRDLSVSRTTFDWGIKVPGDEKHVMYVWVDALTNYLTGLGYPENTDLMETFWPADVHVIGKDIVRFHAIYWPAFLMSAGIALPKRVFGHGFLMNKGEKMSKSIGNVLDPVALADHFGVEQLRYFLLREVPFGKDGNYSEELIINRINADLANDLGNLAQRSLSMIGKNCDGKIPEPGDFDDADNAILQQADAMLDICRDAMDRQAIHEALDCVWNLVGETNRYFADAAPWALKKTDPERMNTVLYVTAELVRQIAILAQPVLPESCNKLLDLVAVDSTARDFASLGPDNRLAAGTALPKPEGVFPRYIRPEAENG
jgi:methionyl-tRNA synthetase